MAPNRSSGRCRPRRSWVAAVPFLCGGTLGILGPSVASASSIETRLSDLNVTQFWRQGYLWIRGFASAGEVAAMRTSMGDLIDNWHLPERGAPGAAAFRSSMSLRNGDEEKDYTYMLDSATKSTVFVEPGAVDVEAGVLRPGVTKRSAVRKVAHALHLTPGPFRDFSISEKVSAAATALGLRKPAVAQSLYRLAPPLAAGVDRHQDSTMLYTDPPTCLGFWVALEDTDQTNGCLRVREGSHREPIRERLVRRGGSEGKSVQLVFENLENDSVPAPIEVFKALEAKSGDLVVMHGALEHVSLDGTAADRSRESFQLHLVDAEAKWSPENWLQYPPDIPFTLLAPLVAPKSLEL